MVINQYPKVPVKMTTISKVLAIINFLYRNIEPTFYVNDWLYSYGEISLNSPFMKEGIIQNYLSITTVCQCEYNKDVLHTLFMAVGKSFP